MLVDADFSLANLDVVMGVNSKYNIWHVVNGIKSVEEIIEIAAEGVEIVCGASGFESLADIDEFKQRRLVADLDGLASEADVVLIDTAAGIGKSVSAFCLPADHVLVVTTPEPAAMTDAYAAIKVLARRRFEGRISLVVNMVDSNGQGRKVYHRIASVARRFLDTHVYYGAVLQTDERLRTAVRRRKPVVQAYPNSQISSSLVAMAARLARGKAAKIEQDGFFRKVVNRFL